MPIVCNNKNMENNTLLAYRGCKAITSSNGATSVVVADGMTRGPAVRLPSAKRAAELMSWVKNPDNFYLLASAFNSTSRFARLSTVRKLATCRPKFNYGRTAGFHALVFKARDDTMWKC